MLTSSGIFYVILLLVFLSSCCVFQHSIAFTILNEISLTHKHKIKRASNNARCFGRKRPRWGRKIVKNPYIAYYQTVYDKRLKSYWNRVGRNTNDFRKPTNHVTSQAPFNGSFVQEQLLPRISQYLIQNNHQRLPKQVSNKSLLQFLVNLEAVYLSIDELVSSDSELHIFAAVGPMVRTFIIAQDIDKIVTRLKLSERPQPDACADNYIRYINEAFKASSKEFLVSYHLLYSKFTNEKKELITNVMKTLGLNFDLKLQYWDGDTHSLEASLDKVAERWSEFERQACLQHVDTAHVKLTELTESIFS